MVSFYVYDIAILVLFAVLLIAFFYKHKKNLTKESVFLMYRSQVGVKVINYIGDNFKKTLNFIKYLIIAVGVILTFTILWMLGKTFYIYAVTPNITDMISAPPIAPLVPYFPELFGLESFFPHLYFVYFIAALAVVMIVHEFSHGIYMRLFKIKIKSTGLIFGWLIYTWVFLSFVNAFHKVTKSKTWSYFAAAASSLLVVFALLLYAFTANYYVLIAVIFLVFPLLGAFVEEDKKDFVKKKKLERMSVLGAGVFANVVVGTIFLVLLLTIYHYGYQQAGYAFNSYSFQYLPANGNFSYGNSFEGTIILQGYERNVNLTEINYNGSKFLITSEIKSSLEKSPAQEGQYVLAFDDAPAIRSGLEGGITKIDNKQINGIEDLKQALLSSSPGQEITVFTSVNGGTKEFKITLAENPIDSSKAFLGIAYLPTKAAGSGIISKMGGALSEGYAYITNPDIRGDGNFYEPYSKTVTFFYDMIWWIVIINYLVAIFNMLPWGPFDGGQFFLLGIQSITGSEKIAKWTSRIIGYIIILGFAFVMVMWALGVSGII